MIDFGIIDKRIVGEQSETGNEMRGNESRTYDRSGEQRREEESVYSILSNSN